VNVIFVEEVPGVAKIGQKKKVADGYARNYLIPYGLAVVEGSQAARDAEKELAKKIKARELQANELSEIREKIDGAEITIAAKVGEKDKLYGSVTAADIAAELSKIAGCEIDKKIVELAEPVKVVGSYDVPVKLMWDLVAVVKVHVVSDAPPAPEEKKPRAAKAEEVAPAPPPIDETLEDLAEEVEKKIEEK